MGILKETYSIVDYLSDRFLKDNFKLCYLLSGSDKKSFFDLMKKTELVEFSVQLDLDSSFHYFKGVYDNTEVLITFTMTNDNEFIDLSIFSQSIENITKLYSLIFKETVESALSKVEINIGFYKLSLSDRGEINSSYERLKEKHFSDISEEYYPFIDSDLFINEFFSRNENVLILTGKTGTGKTKFSSLILKKAIDNYNLIKDNRKNFRNVSLDFNESVVNSIDISEILEEEKCSDSNEIKVAYLKNEDMLATEAFWSFLTSQNFDIVIIDDLDYMLIPRAREINSESDIRRAKFISQFLSFTDGIVPTSTKFIITSNKIDKDIDSALMRPGRMFDILSFRDLTIEEALNIWESFGLNKDKFIDIFKEDKSITHAKLGSYLNISKKDPTISMRGYLKDSSLSVINESIDSESEVMGFH